MWISWISWFSWISWISIISRTRELARVLLADSLLGANWPGSERALNPIVYTRRLDKSQTRQLVDATGSSTCTFTFNYVIMRA